jgi:glutathione-regulated potassium-efflux system ancillary protein KefG
MQQTANLTGMKFLPAFKIHSAVVITDEELEGSAKKYAEHILNPELDPQVELKRILKEMQDTGNEL